MCSTVSLSLWEPSVSLSLLEPTIASGITSTKDNLLPSEENWRSSLVRTATDTLYSWLTLRSRHDYFNMNQHTLFSVSLRNSELNTERKPILIHMVGFRGRFQEEFQPGFEKKSS